MKKKVIICGSGPSAAFAIVAASDVGAEYEVISATPPALGPQVAFFLHWVPPSLRCLPSEVVVDSVGTPERYAFKQWGCSCRSSFPRQQRVENWYGAECLAQVWTSTPVQIVKLGRVQLIELAKGCDFLFHTWPIGDNAACRIPVHVEYKITPNRPTITYNGLKDDPWCRRTVAWGEERTEYPRTYQPRPGEPGWTWVQDLPPWTNPVTSRLAPNIIPIGRMARQESQYLAHHAYDEVYRCLTA